MNKQYYLTVCLIICLFCSCSKPTDYYNKDFKWSIRIPAAFNAYSKKDWGKVQVRGLTAIENAYNIRLPKRVTTLFIFKNSKNNYFEAVCEKYDVAGRGSDYNKNIDQNYGIMYFTLFDQIKHVSIDTVMTSENIDGLIFRRIKFKCIYPDRPVDYSITYNRLFGTTELTVSIMYNDEEAGDSMVASFRNSKFGK